MKKTALELALERYKENGGWLTSMNIQYGDFIFLYAGTYYGYVWKKDEADGLEDPDTEHEYGWTSFEEFLNDTMTEVGLTFREVLAAIPAEDVVYIE